MPHVQIIDQVLRATVLTVLQDPQLNIKLLNEKMKTVAAERLSELSSRLSETDYERLQTDASPIIDNLIQSTFKKFSLYDLENASGRTRRASFENERNAGVISFSLPKERGRSHYSSEEYFVNDFIAILSRNELLNIFGIIEVDQVSIALPLFKLRQSSYFELCSSPSMKASETASRYFDTLLCENLKEIDNGFQKENSLKIAYDTTFGNKTNYLNDRRLVELVITSASNALWMLMQPVNYLGVSLSLEKKIELCKKLLQSFAKIKKQLNQSSIPNKERNIIHKILGHVIERVKEFEEAFFQEHKSDLSLARVSSAIQDSLTVINRGAVTFLFDGLQSLNILHTSQGSYGNDLLTTILRNLVDVTAKNKIFLSTIGEYLKYKPQDEPVANNTIQTSMDILIYFCHATPSKKQSLLKELAADPSSNKQSFYLPLNMLNDHYIEPVYKLNEKRLEKKFWQSAYWDRDKHKKIAKETAKQLLPIFCQVIDNCLIKLEPNFTNLNKSALSQHDKIKRMYGQEAQYYDWRLISFGVKSDGRRHHLKLLPKKAKSLLTLLVFNKELQTLIVNNKSLLSYLPFLTLMKSFMSKIKCEYVSLEESVPVEYGSFLQDIKQVSQDIGKILEDVENKVHTLMKQESKFIYQEEAQRIQEAIEVLNEKYHAYFEEDTGLRPVTVTHQEVLYDVELSSEPAFAEVTTYMLTSLRNVIYKCHQSLSSFGDGGMKERSLKDLYDVVDNELLIEYVDKDKLRDQVAEFSKELARIALQTRKLCCNFFQAPPGGSNTALCLYGEIKNSCYDDEFPLAKILLGDGFDIHHATTDDIRVAMIEKYALGMTTQNQGHIQSTPVV